MQYRRHAGKQMAMLIVRGMATALLLFTTAMAQTGSAEELHSRIIVKWKQHPAHTHAQILEAASTHLRSSIGIGMLQRRGISSDMDGMQLQTSLNRKDFAKALAKLNADPAVEFAVEDKRRHALALTNDPLITATSGRTGQWYLNDPAANSDWVAAINAVTAWNYSTGGTAGSGVIVAVVDTGIRADHPDLAGKLLPGYDFVNCDQTNCTGSGLTYYEANDGDGWDNDPSDPGDWVSSQDKTSHPAVFDSSCAIEDSSWHGTRVAGIIGAATNNGIGIAGIGYNARILPVRALGKCGGYDSDITAAMRWAAGLSVPGVPVNPNPAKVINLSVGGQDTCAQTAYPTVVSEIRAAGVAIVASAGNDSAAVNAPANCSGVIGVTALRNTGTKVGFSSLGPEVSISAPGGNCGNSTGPCLFSIDTTTNLGTTVPGTNDYTDQTNANLGTSFSAPIVSGTIALMLGANPTLTPSIITSRLQATATAFPQTETTACVSPLNANASTINSQPCNCNTSLCGAGMVNALAAVQSVALPTVVITGDTSVALGGSDMLDASTSTAANGQSLTYTWSKVTDNSGTAMLSSTSGASITVTAPNINETLVVRLTAKDSWNNTSSKDFSITVGTGGSSSSSASSASSGSNSSSSTSTSSAVATSNASSNTITGATKGGGSFDLTWLLSLAAVFALRTRLNKTTPRVATSTRYF